MTNNEKRDAQHTEERYYYDAIVDELSLTFDQKNKDYGNSYFKALDEDGLVVAKIMMGIKMNRFITLLERPAEVEESLEDTVKDLANYGILTAAWIKKGGLTDDNL